MDAAALEFFKKFSKRPVLPVMRSRCRMWFANMWLILRIK